MATAQESALEGEVNATMSPSPKFFTSIPFASAMAWRRMEKCPRRSSSASSGDKLDASLVEPTMSVNSTVTFSVVTGMAPPSMCRTGR
jgi:hypothetical protein